MDSGLRCAAVHGLRVGFYTVPQKAPLPQLWRRILRRVLEPVQTAAKIWFDQGGSRVSGLLHPRGGSVIVFGGVTNGSGEFG